MRRCGFSLGTVQFKSYRRLECPTPDPHLSRLRALLESTCAVPHSCAFTRSSRVEQVGALEGNG
jgi:hypothetical protein